MAYDVKLGFLFLLASLLLTTAVFVIMDFFIKRYFVNLVKKSAPAFTNYVRDLIRFIAIVISTFAFLISVSYSMELFNIAFIQSMIDMFVKMLPKLLIIFIIVGITFFFLKVTKSLILKLKSKYAEFIFVFLQVILVFAVILTILEYLGIMATPFMELFRVILYTIGLTIAISFGIAIGFSIQNRMKQIINGKRKKH